MFKAIYFMEVYYKERVTERNRNRKKPTILSYSSYFTVKLTDILFVYLTVKLSDNINIDLKKKICLLYST